MKPKAKRLRRSKRDVNESENNHAEMKPLGSIVFPIDVTEKTTDADDTGVKIECKDSTPDESSIINVIPMIEETILETSDDPGAATTVDNDLLTEGKAFIPDVKPEVEDNCTVFLPQRSMIKVGTNK